jgi:hypothetical protein
MELAVQEAQKHSLHAKKARRSFVFWVTPFLMEKVALGMRFAQDRIFRTARCFRPQLICEFVRMFGVYLEPKLLSFSSIESAFWGFVLVRG